MPRGLQQAAPHDDSLSVTKSPGFHELQEVVGGMEGALSPLLSMSLQDLEEVMLDDQCQSLLPGILSH